MATSTFVFVCLCSCLFISTQAQFPYRQLGMSPTDVPSGPVDMQTPTFEAVKNFGTVNSGDAMEHIFDQNSYMMDGGIKDFLIEGDVVVDYNVTEEETNKNSARTRRNALRDRGVRWENGVVPYVIDNRYDGDTRARILEAMRRYHANTCLRFVQRQTEANYIYIFPGSGCWSLVGRVGGMQQLSLGTGCTTNLGTIVHELMHAIGFHHEQTRADRDNYVYIYRQNIIQGLEYNFDKYDLNYIDHLGTNYDYFSVMHYHMTAFSANGQPTIVARDGTRLNYRSDFSSNDLHKINIYYECGEVTNPTPDPTPEECIDRNQDCSYWAQIGECEKNPQWMLPNCPVSCEQCPTVVTTKAPPTDDCVDTNEYCPDWARAGHCELNPSWMLPNCPLSCEQCETTPTGNCRDQHDNCATWGRFGQCEANPSYMLEFCPRTCGQCGDGLLNTCENYHDNCDRWAQNNQCEENPGYMNYQCRKACNLCSLSSPLQLVPQVQCQDSNANCPIFRDMGMCENDAKYMNYFCPQTCGRCPGQLTDGGNGGNGASGRWSVAEWLAVILASLLFSRWMV